MAYQVLFSGLVEEQLMSIDKAIRERMIKRIKRMEYEPPGRHMQHGLGFFVIEVGQCRVVYKLENDKRIIYFVGLHKDYEIWFKSKAER